MPKEKILLVSCQGLGKGGIQAVLMSIVRQLSHKYIFDIILFTDEKRYYEDEFEGYGGRIIRIPFYEGKSRFRKNIDFYIRGNRLYREVSKEIKINGPYKAIHCNNFFESALCVKAAKKFNIPVRIVHNHICMSGANLIKRLMRYIYLKIIKKCNTHLIGCSEEACVTIFGKNQNYTVVPNPYNEKIFRCKINPDERRKFELAHVGVFDDNKNQLFALEVISEIAKKYPDAKIHFVGKYSDEYKEKIDATIERLKIEKSVIFHDFDSDIPPILDKSSAFIFPSLKEGFGIALLEAQAMGLKCYVSDAVPKIADMGGCTFLSLKDGAKKWADKIIDDYQKYEGKHSFYDCSKYTTENIVKIFEIMYEGDNK